MSSIKKNYNNEKFVNSKEKIPQIRDFDKKSSSKEFLNENRFGTSKEVSDNKKIILNTFVNITVELGKSKIKIKDFLNLSKGSMLILDKSIKEPLDIFINDHLIASGEIVFLEKKYGLRITSIKKSLKTINIPV